MPLELHGETSSFSSVVTLNVAIKLSEAWDVALN